MFKFLKLKSEQGPWGPWDKPKAGPSSKSEDKEEEIIEVQEEVKSSGNGGGDNDNKEPEKKEEESKKGETPAPKKEEAPKEPKAIKGPWGNDPETEKKYNEAVSYLAKRNGGGGRNGGGSGSGGDIFDKMSKSPKKFGGLLILGVIALWLASGFYKVDSDENAIVLYFGKFHGIATPGLNYHLPYPIAKAVKQRVTTVNTEEFGYNSGGKRYGRRTRGNDIENLMLTGDENIVDIEFQVQWQISDIEDYSFNIQNPRLAIRQAAESAMREVIAKTPISEALSDGKSQIEQATKEKLQETLDSYKSGVRITLVQLRRVDPPTQVIDAFRDVQTAKADKEREINEAQAYANDIIPRARGNAAEMQQKAEAYRNKVEADAEGEAKRFLALYGQYKNAKDITRKRIYLETMKNVYGDVDKIIIDKKASQSSIFPYFPLNDLNRGAGTSVVNKK